MARTIANWLIRVASLGLVAMVAIVGWQVFGRYILDSSPSWTEQAALVLMIWYVMLASAAGVYEGFHIRIALLDEHLGAGAVPLRRLIALIVLALGLVMAVYGLQLCWIVRGNVIPSLEISRAVAYAPLPIAGALIALFSFPQMLTGEDVDREAV